jgi:hypothetical protein
MTVASPITIRAEVGITAGADGRSGSNSEVGGRNREVRFTSESRLNSDIAPCPKSAKTGSRSRLPTYAAAPGLGSLMLTLLQHSRRERIEMAKRRQAVRPTGRKVPTKGKRAHCTYA